MRRIEVPRMAIVSLFIAFLSICGLVMCAIKINSYHHPIPLTYFSEDNLKSGKYVNGTITSYVISPNIPKGAEAGYFGEWHDINGVYIGFIIPFNEEQYIHIWIDDPESIELLNQTQDGRNIDVPFVGKITACDSPVSYTDEQLGFDHNKLITEYEIVQKNLAMEKFWLKTCFVALIVAFLLYCSSGKIQVSQMEYENKNMKSTSQRILHHYNLSAEIIVAEKNIDKYDKLEKEYRKWGFIGLACVVVGTVIFVKNVKFISFFTLVSCLLLIGYGIRRLWIYFINSKNSFAVYIAGIFNLSTLQIKREEAYRLLTTLKNSEEISVK